MRQSGLEITTHIGCPHTCKYCPQSVLQTKYNSVKAMSPAMFELCLSKVPRQDIYFSGFCEPWVNPCCSDMVLLAHKHNHDIVVNTTLDRVTPNDILKISKVPFRYFHVHLPDNEMILEVTAEYLSKLELLIHSGISNLRFRHHARIDSRIKDVVGSSRVAPLNTRAGNIKKAVRRDGRLKPCAHWGRHVLLPNGDVVLCCMDYGLQHKLGNLAEGTWDDLHDSEEYKRILLAFTNTSVGILCRTCEAQPYKGRKNNE